jgi:hypothetical protein
LPEGNTLRHDLPAVFRLWTVGCNQSASGIVVKCGRGLLTDPQFGAVRTFVPDIDGIESASLEWSQVTQISPWTTTGLLQLNVIISLGHLYESGGAAISTIIEIFCEIDTSDPDLVDEIPRIVDDLSGWGSALPATAKVDQD